MIVQVVGFRALQVFDRVAGQGHRAAQHIVLRLLKLHGDDMAEIEPPVAEIKKSFMAAPHLWPKVASAG